MKAITLIFPHQLFPTHPALADKRPVYLVEETLFFNQYSFHKQKLVLHRATMKGYEQHLTALKYKVSYIDAVKTESDVRQLIPLMATKGVNEIHYCDPVDDWLEKRIINAAKKAGISLFGYDSPNFLNTPGDAEDFYAEKQSYFLNDFYIWQRKKHKLLLDERNRPEGGKWSYDAENRKRFPAKALAPERRLLPANDLVKEARIYVEKHFSENYGQLQGTDSGFYPVTYEEAETWLEEFLGNRFKDFGVYQDAMVGKEHFLHHSVLTPMLNIGLLSPQQVINEALQSLGKHGIPMNSVEGFIRQMIGWREFIRIVYVREGVGQRTKNFWGFSRKIPPAFWKGETGIPPIDIVIKKLNETAYAHHIERLMVLANFMLLCEFDPDEVYKWFMELFIDSYDWVMVPNVYGMTQFADGGLMATKPYISGSNYLLKMSDFKRGPWTEIWDGLFWRFMYVHRDFFEKNQRLSMLLRNFDKMPKEKRQHLLETADNYLQSLDTGEGIKQGRMFD